MTEMIIRVDDAQVRALFQQAPSAFIRRLLTLLEAGASDVQRNMRENAPVGAGGELRRSIKYKISRTALTATIGPSVNYGQWVNDGTGPHWTSWKEGSSLAKWAKHKGLNPFLVARSIAKKGTKGKFFIEKTYNSMHRQVEQDLVRGMARFAQEMNSGQV